MQLRFHPILKIGERLADFQEKVRPRFPGYDLTEGQTLDLTPLGPQVRTETMHRFRTDGGPPIVVSLNTSAISLEYSEHRDRSILLEDVGLVLGALKEVYSPIAPLRLGLRYVNVIDREGLAQDLGRPVKWAELLTPAFASVPGGLAVLDDDVASLASSQRLAPAAR